LETGHNDGQEIDNFVNQALSETLVFMAHAGVPVLSVLF
jgi:hypothetical protein